MKKAISLIIFLHIQQIATSQLTIRGQLIDVVSKESIPFATILIKDIHDDLIISHGISDHNGLYSFDVNRACQMCLLEIRHIGYQGYNRIINNLGTQGTIKLQIDAKLIPLNNELDELVISAPPPILIKEDTIVYDMASWVKNPDSDVESVIASLPGLKVLADGEIEYKGRAVDHVLINGKKVSDVGSGIITQNLAAGNIQFIEVRTNEKNNELKNSLLSNKNILVLDLITKQDVDQSLLGFLGVGATAINEEHRINSYNSIFSLNPKFKIHLLSESSPAGPGNVKLSNIKNIGYDAYAEIFNVPADYSRLTQKETFNQDIYGFENYLDNKSYVGAITSFWTLSEKWDIFTGSFIKDGSVTQTYSSLQKSTLGVLAFNQSKHISQLSFKNKAKIQFNSQSTKFVANIDYIRDNNIFQDTLGIEEESVFFYNQNLSTDIFSSLQYERLLSKAVVFGVYGLYHDKKRNDDISLSAPNQYLISFLQKPTVGDKIEQQINDDNQNIHLSAKLQWKKNNIAHTWGMRYFKEIFNNGKGGNTISLFDGETSINYTKAESFISTEALIGQSHLQAELGLGRYKLSQSQPEINQNFNLSIDLPLFSNISATMRYKSNIGSFPYRNITEGYELVDFQSIALPQAQSVNLQREETLEFSISSDPLKKYGWEWAISGIQGNLNNGPNITSTTQQFLKVEYEQNNVPYALYVLNTSKRIVPIKGKIDLELGYMALDRFNFREKINNTRRFIINLNLNSELIKSKYNILIKNSFRSYQFNRYTSTNDLIRTNQKIYIVDIRNIVNFKPLDQKLVVIMKYGNISDAENINQNYIVSATYSFKKKAFTYLINCHNILNEQSFEIREIQNTLESIQQTRMMPRNISFGLRYNFK